MKHLSNIQAKAYLLFSFVLAANLALTHTATAAPATGPVNLATSPLTTATTTAVKPNLMFILDDSGSMNDDALPDWAGSGSYSADYYYKNSDFNGLAYNPAITYEKPVFFNADGTLNTTTYPSQTGLSLVTGADTTATMPNWKKVKKNAYDDTDGLTNLGTGAGTGHAYYYTVIAGEYCTALDFKSCVAATAPTGLNIYPAPLRWCTTNTIAKAATTPGSTCQSINDASHSNPRYPSPRVATITVNTPASGTTVSSIKVNGVEILSSAIASTVTTAAMATAIADKINACTSAVSGQCGTSGYAARVTSTGGGSNTITLVAPTNTSAFTYTPVISKAGSMSITSSAFSAVTGSSAPGVNRLTVISPATTSYVYPGTSTVSANRNDCTGTCTYAKEMENYANWWTYYHVRLQTMKTSVSRSFKGVDSRYRVGLTTINSSSTTASSDFLPINTFELAHKNTWFTTLFGVVTNGNTPLRDALSRVGRLYAHKITGAADPMQYSCQQNFSILSTDGYWNGGAGKQLNGTTDIGNLDGGTTLRPYKEGTTATSNTLADVAKYYYDTDLRTFALGNCTGAIGTLCSTPDATDPYNNVFVSQKDSNTKQHMTTFTMGLGIDGTLNFTTDYETATSGDYYRLKTGTAPTTNWPNPIANTNGERIDDLWHAAVNGRGVYFSARRPEEIVAGFTAALASITSRVGAGAAAATSTLNPVAGNNFAYVASYTTGKWTGNLEARTINITTGVVSESASWCVENVIAGSCPAPGVVTFDSVAGVYNCVTGAITTEVPISCTGKMASLVDTTTDTRKIWTKGINATSLNNFKLTGGDLSAADFNTTKLAGLSQWATLTGIQKTAAVGDGIVNFLRGQTGLENRSSNLAGTVDNRLFRYREATLGDAVESQPVYIDNSTFEYVDSGYAAFKASTNSRPGTVYMGTNDGMLHAFDAPLTVTATAGNERWAYVPSMVIPNMFALADENYSLNHAYYANGSPFISDIFDGSSWKTILVAGLNGGGRGYYALDVTNPILPKLLWEFTPAADLNNPSFPHDADLGFTFGNPIITKKNDGTWVVLVTSGNNNIPDTSPRVKNPLINSGDGQGYLYVLNAGTGAIISKIGTGVGSVAVPSGLSKITATATNSGKNNTATFTYGGDLLGNVWRFDINTATVTKFAELKDSGGTAQPITTSPELGEVLTSDGKTRNVVFIGTGKYLETADLTDTQQQTLYAIKDSDTPATSPPTATLVNPRTYTSAGPNHMVQQIISTSGSNRTATNNVVDFGGDRGWYVNFPDVGERQNVASKLVLGTLLVPTTVPSNTVCAPGGTSWFNYFNYKTGGGVDSTNKVSTKMNSPIVGINVMYIPNPLDPTGDLMPIGSAVTADKPTPENVIIPFDKTPGGFRKNRVIWRELIQ